MKHLVHEKHHPHLKKRALIELLGLFGLVTFIIVQRDILSESIDTIIEVEALWFLLLLSCWWLVLPLTALSYKMISPKPKRLNIYRTILAHLAGAGPGRIIPGGIGGLSINSLHLKKTGLSIEQAIGVVLTNNAIGIVANIGLVLSAVFLRPETSDIIFSSVSSSQLVVAAVALSTFMVLIQWLLHARSTRREVRKTSRQWRKILVRLFSSPKQLVAVVFIALLITCLHALMLDFSAFALLIDLSFADALIAFSFGTAIGGILPTPGGVGGVEAGITAALLVLGYDAAAAASIAVLFRVATYWQPLLPGTLSYLYLRERKLL